MEIFILTAKPKLKKLLTPFFHRSFPATKLSFWGNHQDMLKTITAPSQVLVIIDTETVSPEILEETDSHLHKYSAKTVIIKHDSDTIDEHDYFCLYKSVVLVIKGEINPEKLNSHIKMLSIIHFGDSYFREFSAEDLIRINSGDDKYRDNVFDLINHSNEGMWLWDVGSNRISLSDLFRKSLGYSKDELFDDIEMFVNLIHSEDKTLFRSALNDYFEHKKSRFSVEIRLLKGDGSYNWYLLRGFSVWSCKDIPVKMLGIQMDINEMKERIEVLENMALHDHLTGLPNRSLLYDRITRGIINSSREDRMLGLLYIDIDNFKSFNDKYGHKIGDEVLKETAKRLLDCVRKIDTVSRLHGDEFIIVIPMLSQPEDTLIFSERINKSFSVPMQIEDYELQVFCSIGASVYPIDGNSVEALMHKADISMYKRKNLHRNLYKADEKDKDK